MKNAVKSTIILFIVVVVTSGLVALVYEVTAEPIAEILLQRETETIARMLPGTYEITTHESEEGIVRRLIIGYDEAGNRLGYVAAVAPVGYSGAIEMMVGFCNERNVRDVEIIRQTETPGLGTAILEQSFLAQFSGVNMPLYVTRTGAGENEIAALASATISTEAVVNGVNAALAHILDMPEEDCYECP